MAERRDRAPRNSKRAQRRLCRSAPARPRLYGPKLDSMATDSIGREHQVATIQLDMNLPERFDLTCVNERGEKERIVMIHSAITGSIERFFAVLLNISRAVSPRGSPVQVKILPAPSDTRNTQGPS